MKKQKYELLAPVGNFSMLIAAIEAGADAVYLGMKEFNMRDNARNFSLIDLKKVREICKKRNIKIYLTLNTIIYGDEIKRVEKVIKKIKQNNLVDAIICWDLSVINLCRKYKIHFHISTQASVSNIASAKFYSKLGAERIVLARELSLNQIKRITKHLKIGIECFAHGAMCVSVSGRCFTSQFLNGSKCSANRGRCSHPCRREWIIKDEKGRKLKLKNNKVMSAKDLCSLPFIEKMKKAGIISFKIEGRNRSPEYVKTVISVYRKAIDKKLSHTEILEGIEELKKVYNRGFSSGFYIRPPTDDDFSFSENGEQTEYKELVGRVNKYWPKVGVAHVKMFHGKLKIGDEIFIIGDKIGVKRFNIESMEINKKQIMKVGKGEEVGIKLPTCYKGDEIYIIKKRRG